MSEPWRAEREVDHALARSLIESQFPTLAPVRLRSLDAGWDNTAYVVNDIYVFRFPRRQIAVSCMEAEIAVLPGLPPLPLPISTPLFVGRGTESFPWPFAGYRWIDGIDASVADLDDRRRIAAAEPLGRFLAALHAVDAEQATELGAGPDTLGRLDLDARTQRMRERIDQMTTLGSPAVADSARRALAAARAAARSPERTNLALVHGDFYCRNLLVDTDGRVNGVVDWGDVHLGHPAVDLSIAYTFLPPEAYPVFVSAYGGIDDATAALARWRAVHYAVILTLYGRDIGDDGLVREGVRTLERLGSG
ncbi:MAG: phosphotransferase [Phycisphaerales bacterium]|nr:phosphotransferase [Phycisphaerales bacterium]